MNILKYLIIFIFCCTHFLKASDLVSQEFAQGIIKKITPWDRQNLSLVSKFWNSQFVMYFNTRPHQTLTFDETCILENIHKTLAKNRFSKIDISYIPHAVQQNLIFSNTYTMITYVKIQNLFRSDDLSEGTEDEFRAHRKAKQEKTASLLEHFSLDTLPHLKVLNVGCNSLSLASTTVIARLTTLEEIDAGESGLEDEALYPLTQLPNLLTLDVINCMLHFNDARGLPFPKLKSLIADNNEDLDDQSRINLSRITTLESLKLISNGIINTSFEGLTQLRNLKELSLIDSLDRSRNPGIMEPTALPSICKLSILEKLELESTPLQLEDVQAFGQLPHLKDLLLRGCGLNQASVKQLGSLRSLQFLSLPFNNFERVNLEPLTQLALLKTLYLSGCRLGVGALPTIGTLTNLRELGLNDNNFLGTDLKPLKDLTHLKRLHLSNFMGQAVLDNPACLETIGGFTKLKTLSLSSNTLGMNNDLSALSSLENLERLSMDTCMINTQKALNTLGKLTKLDNLSLSSNPFPSKADISVFQNLNNLCILNLENCNLTDKALDVLVDLPRLRDLRIVNQENNDMHFVLEEEASDQIRIKFNPLAISSEAIELFKAKRPNIGIY